MSNSTSQILCVSQIAGLFLVLFIGLKLTGYIAWTWWWVLAPVWLPMLVVTTLIFISGLIKLFTK